MVSVRTVKKRSGQTVPYDTKKIYRAIQGANNDSGEMSKADVNHVVLCVDTLLKKTEALTVEGIQDTVEETLMDQGFKKTAREYIRYRHLHEMRRNATQKLMESYDDLLFADAKDVDLKRDNANINTDAPMGIMLKLGTEGAKVYSDNYAIPEEFVEADKQNILHIHDKDFGMITWNCLSGDTRIVFKNALGSVKEVPFSYFDPFFERFGSMVSVEHCGFSVLSKNGKYDKVKRLMRRKHSGDIRKFVLSNGISFLATDDHQVALANGDVKNAKDVAVGEEIPITQYPDWEETIKEINLIDAFGPEERGIVISNSDYIRKNVPNERKSYFYDLLRGKKDCESNEALYNKDFTLHEYFAVRGISDIDERKLQLKAKKSRESIDAILPLNNAMGKIVGFVLSKGYLSADGTQVIFANSDQNILDSFKESISRIFPALNVVHRRRGSNKSTSGCDTINVFGKIFNRLFRGILAKQNLSNDIEIPKWYLNTSKDFLAGFIGAEIDGDGTVDNGYRMIVATNAKAYAYSIFDLLLKFNISAKVSIAQEEGSQAVVNGIPTTRNYDVYAVSCSGEALDNLAGFLHGSSIKINRISDKKLARRKRHDGKIVAIDRVPYVGYVYDFETEGHYFSANGILTHNCLQQDLAKTLKNGFNTGHGFLREPNSIRAAAALACIAIQSSQNDMLGGQSISCWDGALAPYVDKSFRKAFRGNLEKVISVVGCYDFGDAGSIDALKKEIKSLPESYIPAYVESFEKRDAANGFDIDGLCRFVSEKLNGANFTAREVWQVWNLSCRDVEEETKQAMEAAIHNFNSLHSRAGSQTPFSSLNYGLDTTPEGRLVTRMTLEAIWEGLGHGETPIFPISIFLLKSGVNYNPGDPNYDLFKEACKVSAKRLFPNFLSQDAPFNIKYYKEGDYKSYVTAMGCADGDEIVSYKYDGVFYCEGLKRLWERAQNNVLEKGVSEYFVPENLQVWDASNGRFVDVKTVIKNPDQGNWVRVKFSHGRSILVTDDHPLYTENRGRIHVRDLEVGDTIESYYTLPDVGNDGSMLTNTDEAYALGLVLVDGCYDGGISVTLDYETEQDIMETFVERVRNAWGKECSVIHHQRGYKGDYYQVCIRGFENGTRKLLEEVFSGRQKINRNITPEVFNASRDVRVAFLAGMIDGDGHVSHKSKVQIGSTNKELALQQLALAQSLGYPAKLYLNCYSGHDASKIRYLVEFSMNDEIAQYLGSMKKAECQWNGKESRTKTPSIIQVESIKYLGNLGKNSYDLETETDKFTLSFVNSGNCRTRVVSNVNGPEESSSRGNFAFVTVNLPMLALMAEKDEKKFFKLLDKYVMLSRRYLEFRYSIISHKKVKNFPFVMGQHLWMGSEELGPEDEIGPALKHASLSIGFCGLAECLVALIGKHHGESDEAQQLGLKIVRHIRHRCDEYTNETHMNWTCFSTPAESTAGSFLRATRKKFGNIPGITDHDYFTNSFHVPVYYPTKAIDKIRIEAPYHAECNAGAISYVEMDGDPSKNLQAFEAIVRAMHDAGMGYYSINHPVDRDPVCGYTGIIDNECPHCHRHENGVYEFKMRL